MVGLRGLPATFGGIEKHVEELGSRLAAAGHEVTVYCRPSYAADPDAIPPEFGYVPPLRGRPGRYRGMILHNLPAPEGKGLEAFVHSGLAVAATLGRGYDIVHFQDETSWKSAVDQLTALRAGLHFEDGNTTVA